MRAFVVATALLLGPACGGGEGDTPPATLVKDLPSAAGGDGALAEPAAAPTSTGSVPALPTSTLAPSVGEPEPSVPGPVTSAPNSSASPEPVSVGGSPGSGGSAGAVGTVGAGGSGAAVEPVETEPVDTGGASGAAAEVGGSAGNPGASGGSDDPGTEPLSFARDIWPVYERIRDPVFVYPGAGSYESCAVAGVCHGGESPGAGLRMPDAETAYDDLVGVPSRSALCDGTLRVVPGDPESSCLVLFYRGRLMEELDWVGQAEIDLMVEWILAGALP